MLILLLFQNTSKGIQQNGIQLLNSNNDNNNSNYNNQRALGTMWTAWTVLLQQWVTTVKTRAKNRCRISFEYIHATILQPLSRSTCVRWYAEFRTGGLMLVQSFTASMPRQLVHSEKEDARVKW